MAPASDHPEWTGVAPLCKAAPAVGHTRELSLFYFALIKVSIFRLIAKREPVSKTCKC